MGGGRRARRRHRRRERRRGRRHCERRPPRRPKALRRSRRSGGRSPHCRRPGWRGPCAPRTCWEGILERTRTGMARQRPGHRARPAGGRRAPWGVRRGGSGSGGHTAMGATLDGFGTGSSASRSATPSRASVAASWPRSRARCACQCSDRTGRDNGEVLLRGRFLPLFHPEIICLVCGVGSRQEMVFSPVRRRAMRSVMAMWICTPPRPARRRTRGGAALRGGAAERGVVVAPGPHPARPTSGCARPPPGSASGWPNGPRSDRDPPPARGGRHPRDGWKPYVT